MVNKLDSLVPKVLRSKTDDNYSSSVEFPSKALLDILTNNNQSIFLHTASFITKCHMLSYLANCHWSSAVDETNSLHPNISVYILLSVLDTQGPDKETLLWIIYFILGTYMCNSGVIFYK